jgi:hypothetical protein
MRFIFCGIISVARILFVCISPVSSEICTLQGKFPDPIGKLKIHEIQDIQEGLNMKNLYVVKVFCARDAEKMLEFINQKCPKCMSSGYMREKKLEKDFRARDCSFEERFLCRSRIKNEVIPPQSSWKYSRPLLWNRICGISAK